MVKVRRSAMMGGMADNPSGGGAGSAEKEGSGANPKQTERAEFWGTLTPWTLLGLGVTAAWLGVLDWVVQTAVIPELDRLPVVMGALIVYVIIMATGARVAYKRCHRG
jgi:hypothetical protein